MLDDKNEPAPSRALSIAEVRARITDGRVASADLTRDCLRRINQLNDRANAVVTLNPRVISDARLIDRSLVRNRPLFGIPFTIKDAFETAGLRTTSGHRPLRSFVPDVNAVAVDRLLNAGGVLVGKTNLSELAGDPQCRNPVFGVTNNPWDVSRTSGGSSGGSAAAVSLGFSWLDLGSDLAGSIRIPASYCGVVGFKATEGRLPGDGHIPPLPGRPQTVRHMLSFGLLTRRVQDARVGLDALTPSECGSGDPIRDASDGNAAPAGWQLKLAYWDDFDGLPLCTRTRQALRRTVNALAGAGNAVERRRPDGFDFGSIWGAFGTVAGTEIGAVSNPLVRSTLAALAGLLGRSHPIARGFLAGLCSKPAAYADALRVRNRAIDDLERFMDSYDAWILPTAPCVAYRHLRRFGMSGVAKIRFEGHALPYLAGTIGCTAPFSLTGSPVVSLPCFAIDGLPVGLQFVGRRAQDEHLLQACAMVEKVVEGYRPPPLLADDLRADILARWSASR